MFEAIDGTFVRFLGWFVGADDDPGVAERNTARVKGLFYILILGLAAPFVTIILGLLAGWVFGSVGLARTIMAFGIIPGVVVGTILGLGFALVVDVVVRTLGNTPEEAGEFIEAYSGALAWVLVAEELAWLLAPYAPLWAIFVGLVMAFAIVHMVIGWNLPLTWSRTFAFRFQMALLVLVLTVSVSNFYEREYFFARAEKSVVVNARNAEAERERALRTAEIADVAARIANPRTSPLYLEAAKRGFADKAAESSFIAKEYQRAREDMARWEDRGYPRPVRWLRATWREYIE